MAVPCLTPSQLFVCVHPPRGPQSQCSASFVFLTSIPGWGKHRSRFFFTPAQVNPIIVPPFPPEEGYTPTTSRTVWPLHAEPSPRSLFATTAFEDFFQRLPGFPCPSGSLFSTFMSGPCFRYSQGRFGCLGGKISSFFFLCTFHGPLNHRCRNRVDPLL